MTLSSFDLSPLIQAAAHELGAPVTGDVRWFVAGESELCGLTPADRELIRVATGERLPERSVTEQRVSFFALQIAVDRLVGPLRGADDVTASYLEDVYTAHEESPHGMSVCGDLLDLSLAYVVGRELAALGPDLS